MLSKRAMTGGRDRAPSPGASPQCRWYSVGRKIFPLSAPPLCDSCADNADGLP